MKNLFDAAAVAEVKDRLARLTPDSRRAWGRMSPAQMLAHCATVMGDAVGDTHPPRQVMGLLFGRMARPGVASDKPLPRNAPTARWLRMTGEHDFAAERERLMGLVDRFAAGGEARCTTHPHSFFGPLTPHQWSVWMYKHLDHHLRQFQI